MISKSYKYIDLFCGIGGFRIALDRLGHKCVFSSDIEEKCQGLYKSNFGDLPKGDITSIPSSKIPKHDILVGGFPCQPFSYAGKKKGFDDTKDGQLFFEILRILNDRNPKMFLLENVKGIKAIEGGNTVDNIVKSLEDSGYKVFTDILNSYNFGVPQYRERWFCVGFDKDIYYQFPKGDKRGSIIKDIIDLDNNDESLIIPKRERVLIDNHFLSKETRVKHEWKYSRPDSKIGKHGMYSYLKPDNTLRFHVGDRAKSQIQDFYYISVDSVAPAIIVTRQPKLWDLKRFLSLKECQRLQGFPEDFKFDSVRDTIGRKLLGNSVTVPVVKAIIDSMCFYYEKNMKTVL